MTRRILFYGNCQVQYIARVFTAQISPFTGDEIRYADVNHTNFSLRHHCEQFRGIDVLVDQVFDAPDPIPPELVGPATLRLRIPNMRGDFLWPFGTREAHPRAAELPADYYYAHEYGDTYLNRMVMKQVPARQAVDAYLAVDFRRERNLGRIFEICMDRQARRDQIAGIKVRRFLLDQLGDVPLFFSPGHPAECLLHLVARPVLVELAGSAAADRALRAQYLGFSSWRVVPIHPAVARFLSLGYAGEDTRYLVFDEGYFTFEEYALRYAGAQSVPELTRALRQYFELDGKGLLALAYAALKQAPTSPLAHRLCAQAFRREGRPDIAIDTAVRAACLEPENPHNIVEIVSALYESGDLGAAETWARLGLSRFPRETQVLQSLCDTLRERGNLGELAKYAARAAELHPGDAPGVLRAARHLVDAEALDAAKTLAESLRRLDPKLAEEAQLEVEIARRAGAAEKKAVLF